MLIPKDRRLGIVRVGGLFMRDQIKDISHIFSKLKAVAFQVEQRYDSETFEYLLYSPLFKIVPPEKTAPEYKIMITMKYSKNGKKSIFKVEVKEIGSIVPFLKERLDFKDIGE